MECLCRILFPFIVLLAFVVDILLLAGSREVVSGVLRLFWIGLLRSVPLSADTKCTYMF